MLKIDKKTFQEILENKPAKSGYKWLYHQLYKEYMVDGQINTDWLVDGDYIEPQRIDHIDYSQDKIVIHDCGCESGGKIEIIDPVIFQLN